MMGSEIIRQFQADAAERAAIESRTPFVLFSERTVVDDVRRATNLGDYLPPGWQRAKLADYEDVLRHNDTSHCATQFKHDVTFFVDKLGFANETEPAISVEELVQDARACRQLAANQGKTVGVGLVEEGQFQIYVQLFEQEG